MQARFNRAETHHGRGNDGFQRGEVWRQPQIHRRAPVVRCRHDLTAPKPIMAGGMMGLGAVKSGGSPKYTGAPLPIL
ncbi:MAG: hypothetical protein GY862_15410 [Gammaproteobacteria bacterium]|nr:hypothetical protein [Gammaproteobacteria bacterium]